MLFFRSRKAALAASDDAAAQRSLKLRRIFDETGDLAWRTLRRFGVPSQWVEDSFQRVFLIVSERLEDIAPGRERSFVYSVTLRVARTYSRMRGREVGGYDADDEIAHQVDVDTLVERARLVDVCDRILSRLSPDLREVFILHEIEGLSGSEIAELLGIPDGTAHSRLRRARLQVRSEVEGLPEHPTSLEVRGG